MRWPCPCTRGSGGRGLVVTEPLGALPRLCSPFFRFRVSHVWLPKRLCMAGFASDILWEGCALIFDDLQILPHGVLRGEHCDGPSGL